MRAVTLAPILASTRSISSNKYRFVLVCFKTRVLAKREQTIGIKIKIFEVYELRSAQFLVCLPADEAEAYGCGKHVIFLENCIFVLNSYDKAAGVRFYGAAGRGT